MNKRTIITILLALVLSITLNRPLLSRLFHKFSRKLPKLITRK